MCKQLEATVFPEQVLYAELFVYAEQNYDVLQVPVLNRHDS